MRPAIRVEGTGSNSERAESLAARGILANYAHLTAAFLSMMVLTPIIVQGLGAEAYGLWVVLGSLLSYFALFDFGLNTAIAKYTAEHLAKDQRSDLSELISTSLNIFLGIGVLIVIAVAILAPLVPDFFSVPQQLSKEARVAFFLIGTNAALALFSGVLSNVLYGSHRIDLWKGVAIFQICMNSALVVIALHFGLGIIGLASCSLATAFLSAVLYYVILQKIGQRINFHFFHLNMGIVRRTAPYSVRTFFLGLTNRMLNYTDYIVIAAFLGPASVTGYEIAFKLCFLSTYLFSAVSSSLFPRFSALYALERWEELRALYLLAVKVSFGIMVPVGIGLFWWGEAFIDLWIRPGTLSDPRLLGVLIAMNFIHVLGTPAAALLQASGQNRGFLASEVVNAVLNLTLSVLLVTRMGIVGVALGTLAASVCSSGWFVPFIACRNLGIPLRRYFQEAIWPPLALGLAISAVTALAVPMIPRICSWLHFFGLACGVGTIYGLLYWFTVAGEAERKLFSSLIPGGITWRARWAK